MIIGKPRKELNTCKVKMVEKHIRSKKIPSYKAFPISVSVYPGPIIIGEYFPKLTIKIKYHKVKIGNQVLIKEFQVNFLKYFKQIVKK